jgi:alpha-beta hydrolase superfamily lysophospholipase
LRLLLAEHDCIIENERTSAFVRRLAWPSRTITVYDGAHHTLEFEPNPERYFEDLVGWYDDRTT